MNENPATKVKFDNRTVIGVSWEWDYQFSSNIVILGMQITPGQISCSGAADQQIMNSFLCVYDFIWLQFGDLF